jgi:drug/metabolite transporter (DMT)-like permease
MLNSSTAQYRLGLLFAALAALSWSQAGVYTRLIEADIMTMLFWRGLFSGTAAFVFHCLIERRFAIGDAFKIGVPGVFVLVLSTIGMMSGIGALRFGKVADAMVIYATVPFITAAIAYVVMKEKPSLATIIASAIAFAGVLIMMTGTDIGGAALGLTLASVMTLSMAIASVLARKHRDLPMLPAFAGSAFLTSIVCLPFASPFSISQSDATWIVMFGVLQNAAGLAFYTLGTKRIPAAEATLLAALEVPLTPLWVWLIINEAPSRWTLIGGAVVLIALFGYIIHEIRRGGQTTAGEFAPTP